MNSIANTFCIARIGCPTGNRSVTAVRVVECPLNKAFSRGLEWCDHFNLTGFEFDVAR